MTTETTTSSIVFDTGDTVEVIDGWDHHRGWIEIGTKITLVTLKTSGEWIGKETGSDRTITIPKTPEKYVKKI